MKTISSYNVGVVIFLEELKLQYLIAEKSWDELKQAAVTWTGHGIPKLNDITPAGDIIADCIVFLSAVGVMSKILYEGSRKEPIPTRCRKLRNLLEVDELQYLKNLSIRNSFEHVDERIDSFVSPLVDKDFLIEIVSVSPNAPKDGTTYFKRFDPNKLSILFGDEEFDLQKCMAEISLIKSQIPIAIRKLEDNIVNLWAT
jgi:hypothetical protein